MQVKISKNIIIEDWEMHPNAPDWWLRPIKHLDREDPPETADYKKEVYVWVHRAKTYYAWEILFTGKSGLGHLGVPFFRSWELEEAKKYVDNIIEHAAKLVAFI